MIPAIRRLLLLSCPTLLLACGSAGPAPEVRLVRQRVPAALLEPLPRPPLPAPDAVLTQGAVAELLVQMDGVVEGYEARMRELARLMAEP